MTGMKARAPFPISSVRTGSLARPSLYAIVEDVVAVDGAQGTAFREAWNKRYLSSLHVRRLLTNLSWYWGVSGVAVAVALTILIFKLDNVDIGFALGKSSSSSLGQVGVVDADEILSRLVNPLDLGCSQCSHHDLVD